MNITSQLSSQVGDNTEQANKKVAALCLEKPEYIQEIATYLSHSDKSLVSDSAEVLTIISETHPQLVTPFIENIFPLIHSTNTKSRWEALHTIANIASFVPDQMKNSLDDIQKIALTDKSTIVRDYATIAIGNYALSSNAAAQQSFPLLKRILEVWKEKLASRVLLGLQNVATADSSLLEEVLSILSPYQHHTKPSVAKAARHVLKQLQK